MKKPFGDDPEPKNKKSEPIEAETDRSKETPGQQAAQLLSVLNSMDQLIFVFDTEGRFIRHFQPASHPILYAEPENFLGKNFRDVLPPGEVRENLARAMEEIRATGGVRHFDYSLPLQGVEKWFHGRLTTMEDPEGRFSGFTAVIHDITKRKHEEKEIRREHQQLLSIFDSIDEPIYVAAPDTYEILFINQALKKIFGDVTGQKCHRALQGLEAPCPFCTNDRIFGEHAGEPYIWEFRNRANQRWYRCIDRAILWPDGRLARYEMAIDITERKKAVDELATEKEHLSVTLRSIGDGVISTDTSLINASLGILRASVCDYCLLRESTGL